MQKIGATLNLSAGDLVGHLNCRHLTELDLKVANGVLEKPRVWATRSRSPAQYAGGLDQVLSRRRSVSSAMNDLRRRT